jgi:hypothetical protein
MARKSGKLVTCGICLRHSCWLRTRGTRGSCNEEGPARKVVGRRLPQPPALELPYTFIFRYALAGYLVALRWMAVGGAKNVKPEKIRNDIVDATFAAYATYFQGFFFKRCEGERDL